jgi:glycosyltransferase involved in cell wall biosynthesis
MKVAYVLDSYPCASETFIAREIAALRRLGAHLEVFAARAGEGAHALPQAPPWQRLLGRLSPDNGRWAAVGRALARQLAGQNFTHIHAGWAGYPAEIAQSAAAALGVPWSFSAHARDIWVEGGDLAEKAYSAAFVAACTRAGAARLLELAPGAPIHYVPHGLPLHQYPWHAWQPSTTAHIIGVGRLVEKKGWNTLIEALDLLPPHLNATLQIIGEGPLREPLQKLVGLRRLEMRVHFAGQLGEEETRQAMSQANCLVLASRVARDGDRDGLANVLVEAAALGVPVVTTDAGAARDLIDEATGRLAWLGDAAHVAAAIAAVYAEPEITLERCRAARARVEAAYNIDCNCNALLEAFLSVRAGSAPLPQRR